MSDPVTDNYSLGLPTQGGDSGVWGTLLNNGDFSPLDAILGAKFPVTINSADVNLSTTQFQNAIFVLSGVLTGNRSLIVPLSPNSLTVACGGRFVVVNNCTGNFNVTVKTAASGSTGVTVPQGFTAFLHSDGTNVGYASNGLPGFALASNGNPNGALAGTAASAVTNASIAYDYANNAIYVCTTTGTSSTAVWSKPAANVLRGFDDIVNLRLNASVSGNLLTIAVKSAETGSDPSATSPVTALFRDSTLTAGDPVTVAITAALSISTFAVGASLGSANAVPFRFWVVLFNNGGTPVLGLVNCSNSSQIFPLNESGLATSVAMSAGATTAGQIYTPNGTTVTSKAFRIIGFVSYETALATAGTYNNAPDVVQLFGPGVKKPGDVVQTIYFQTGASATGTTVIPCDNTVPQNTEGDQYMSQAITPTAKPNVLSIQACANIGSSFGVIQGAAALFQDSTPSALAVGSGCGDNANATVVMIPININHTMIAAISVSTTFKIRAGFANAGTTRFNGNNSGQLYGGVTNSYLKITELMG